MQERKHTEDPAAFDRCFGVAAAETCDLSHKGILLHKHGQDSGERQSSV